MLINIFKKPEIINKEVHKDFIISKFDSYEFAKNAYLVPIGLEEFEVAMKTLIIVFIKEQEGNIIPAAVLGGESGGNLLLKENNEWKDNTYVPAVIRSYPFGIGGNEKESFIVMDTEASCIGKKDGQKLFNSDLSNTEYGEFVFKFVNNVYSQVEFGKNLGKELDSYGILKQAKIQINVKDKDYSLNNGIYVVDQNALNKLESRKLKKLATKGALKLIYAHLFSLSNKY